MKDAQIHNLKIQHQNEMKLQKDKVSRDYERMLDDEK